MDGRAAGLTLWADWCRWRGHYGPALRRWRLAAWLRQPDVPRMLRLGGCWRDHGRPLPARWRRWLEAAIRQPGVSATLRARAEVLLAADRAPEAMEAQRAVFVTWLRAQAPQGGICVVGNAGGALQQALGAVIDAHAVVVRFNRWRPRGDMADRALGRRLDVWGVAPDGPTAPEGTPRWAVMSGADPRGRMAGWPPVQSLEGLGVPVLTVPLAVWRQLVDALAAPPSAGLLMLGWLRHMGWPAGMLRIVDLARPQTGSAHVLGRWHRRGHRHDWARERALVARWCAAGEVSRLEDEAFSQAGDGGS